LEIHLKPKGAKKKKKLAKWRNEDERQHETKKYLPADFTKDPPET
jgi:hypothetical protein